MNQLNRCRLAALLWCGLCLWQISFVQGQQRVSEKKCRDYIAQNTEQSIGATLSLKPELVVYERTNCSTSVDLIINGVEALIGEFPHQALLGKPKKKSTSSELEFYCGGSLISEFFILTAAHCERPMIVRLAEHNISEPSYEEEDFEISDFIRHPQYTVKKTYYDIALVKLSTLVTFSPMIRPACLWTSDPFNISTVVATGFGATETGFNSPVLMKVRLDVVNKSKCEKKFFGFRKFGEGIKEEQMCVGSQEGGKDTCNGDSGGPIQVATDLKTCAYYIVGVTSYGGACGTGTSESVYTKVASYLDWIEQNVWPTEWLESQQDEDYDDPLPLNSGRIYFPGSW